MPQLLIEVLHSGTSVGGGVLAGAIGVVLLVSVVSDRANKRLVRVIRAWRRK